MVATELTNLRVSKIMFKKMERSDSSILVIFKF